MRHITWQPVGEIVGALLGFTTAIWLPAPVAIGLAFVFTLAGHLIGTIVNHSVGSGSPEAIAEALEEIRRNESSQAGPQNDT